jgi:hypothetical protein
VVWKNDTFNPVKLTIKIYQLIINPNYIPMKKLFPFLLLSSFLACNNTADNTSAVKDSGSSITAMAAAANSSGSIGGCGSLLMFQKGAIITGKDFDSSGKERSSSVTTVTNVRSEGNETVSDLQMETHSIYGGKEHNNTIKYSYKCDGSRIKMDLSAFLSNFRALKSAQVEGKALEFPLTLSVGQDLPEASVSAVIDMGKMKMKNTTTYARRKVEKKETISTPAGTWSCFKIVSTIETTMEGGNDEMSKKMAEMMKQRSPTVSTAMWFAPGFGVVRSEFYRNNKLDSRSEIVSIKK